MNIKEFVKDYLKEENYKIDLRLSKNGLFVYGKECKGLSYKRVYTYISKKEFNDVVYITELLDLFIEENDRLA